MEGEGSLAVAVDAHPAPLRSGGEVSWRLTVLNRSAECVSLTFPTAQLCDVILEREGRERYRWSDGQMFAQVLIARRLEPRETWTITLDGRLDVEPGDYGAIAVLACSPQPPVARMAVTVQGR